MSYRQQEKRSFQCFHCGNCPIAVNTGFDIGSLTQAYYEGQIKYFWDCPKCYKENYYTVKEDPQAIKGLIKELARFEPNYSTERFGGLLI